jgi:hypothetical protein
MLLHSLQLVEEAIGSFRDTALCIVTISVLNVAIHTHVVWHGAISTIKDITRIDLMLSRKLVIAVNFFDVSLLAITMDIMHIVASLFIVIVGVAGTLLVAITILLVSEDRGWATLASLARSVA